MILVERAWIEKKDGKEEFRHSFYGLDVVVRNYLKEREGKMLTVKMIKYGLTKRGFILNSQQIREALIRLEYIPVFKRGKINVRYSHPTT